MKKPMFPWAVGAAAARQWRAVAVCTSLLAARLAGAHSAAFTLNDVMQAPYPSDLVAAPAGRAVAWVFDTKGCRNIWVADSSGSAKAHPITAYTEDDGFDIGELAWSPDTKSIAFTRAGTLEDEVPTNVTSSPDGRSLARCGCLYGRRRTSQAGRRAFGELFARWQPSGVCRQEKSSGGIRQW